MSETASVALAQPEVFVSYSSADEAAVKAIVSRLEAAGVSVWRDGDHILGGQYYGERISHAIAHSRVVVLMCSPRAFASDNVHREVLLTWDYYHRTFLPVWLTPPEEIPHRFRYCLVGCQQVMPHEGVAARVQAILAALEGIGISTSRSPPTAGTISTAKGGARGPRFKPGDRPLAGVEWKLVELLGKGGFGEVWKAVHAELASQPPVALKFALNLDSSAKEILRHEAEMVLRVQQAVRNNGVVPLLHAYLSNDPPCLEYAFYEGSTLVRLIDGRRKSPPALATNQVQLIVQRIAHIVGQFHRSQPSVVHCDLKPSNVLVKQHAGKLSLRVTDFGIGRIASEASVERSRSGSSLEGSMAAALTGAHTPLYASPQQMRGQRPDPRDDVYALGVIWFQMLVGDVTAPAPTGRKWMDGLRKQGLSSEGVELLAACLEADPADRPADGKCLAEELARLRPEESPDQSEPINAELLETPPSPGAPPAGAVSRTETVGASLADTQRGSAPAAGATLFAEAVDDSLPAVAGRNPVAQLLLGGSQLKPKWPIWPWILVGIYAGALLWSLFGATLAILAFKNSGDVAWGLGILVSMLVVVSGLNFVPFRILRGASVGRLALIPALLVSATVIAVLTSTSISAVLEATRALAGSSPGSLGILATFLACVSWLAWTGVFGFWVWRGDSPAAVTLQLNRGLLKCSTLGALVSILSHVIERRSGECLAGIGTLMAMFFCYGVMLLVVGPVLVLMVAAHCLELRSAAQLDLAQARQRRVHLAWYVFAAITYLLFMLALATGAKSTRSGAGGSPVEATAMP